MWLSTDDSRVWNGRCLTVLILMQCYVMLLRLTEVDNERSVASPPPCGLL